MRALGLKLLLRPVLGMLGGDDSAPAQHSAGLRRLLLALLAAAQALGGRLQRLALAAVWERCRWGTCTYNRAGA